jgi:hypothetical protein
VSKYKRLPISGWALKMYENSIFEEKEEEKEEKEELKEEMRKKRR